MRDPNTPSTQLASRSLSPAEILGQIRALWSRAFGFDLHPFEVERSGEIASDLVPSIRALASETAELLFRLEAVYVDVALDGELDPEVSSQGRARAPQRQDVGDVAFLVRTELSRRLEGLLVAAPGADHWEALIWADRCLGALRKGLSALEAAFCECEGLDPQLQTIVDLRTSLEIRRVYRKFHAAVTGPGEPRKSEVLARIRHAGAAIAQIVGREVYPRMRVGDRYHFRRLQNRIITWLRCGYDRDTEEGLRVWQDIGAFAELLLEINNRAELVEHDLAVACESLDHIDRTGGSEFPPPLRTRLAAIVGRDSELDRLITTPTPIDPALWRSALERVREALSPNLPIPADAGEDPSRGSVLPLMGEDADTPESKR